MWRRRLFDATAIHLATPVLEHPPAIKPYALGSQQTSGRSWLLLLLLLRVPGGAGGESARACLPRIPTRGATANSSLAASTLGPHRPQRHMKAGKSRALIFILFWPLSGLVIYSGRFLARGLAWVLFIYFTACHAM